MPDSQYNSVNEQRQQELTAWLTLTAPPFSKLQPIQTDAGTRRYFRLFTSDSTIIAVDSDPAHEDNKAFIDIACRLQQSGLRVPEIYHYNLEKGFLLLEDLGDRHMLSRLIEATSNAGDIYQIAGDCMVMMQQRTRTDGLPLFNRNFILLELNIFEDWFINRHLHYNLDQQSKHTILTMHQLLIGNCEQQPQAFMHRDFHSRNLMVDTGNKMAIIDFQGAMLGPVTYDIGSLLKDAYTLAPKELEQSLCEQHRSSLSEPVSAEQYEYWYRLTALQRHLKIMGLFCRLHYRDGKSQYLSHLPTVAQYINDTLDRYSKFSEFSNLFNRLLDRQSNKLACARSTT